MNVIAGLIAARLHRYGPEPAANIATTLLARGECALILAAIAATAGIDRRLAPFIAGYVLILAVLGPIVAGHPHWLARGLQATEGILPASRARPAAPQPAAPHRACDPDDPPGNPATLPAASRPAASTPNKHTPAD